jgi:NADPH-dependent curcumin reductase CurA
MSANESNGQWRIRSYPQGEISDANFEFQREPVPVPGPGEFLVKTTHLIITPPLRMALGTGGIAGRPLPVGSLMRGSGQGRVVASNHPGFSEGDLVSGPFGWQEYAVSDGASLIPVQKVTPFGSIPVTANLHAMGSGGATAFVGLYDIARPCIGDVVLVSAAAGNVGSIVCQLAKLSGCRVVGIAGSDAKCRWLTEDLGVDAAINYKTADVAGQLAVACPDGIDIYFDNVGGETLDAALERINQGARVVLCGATSQYEGDARWYGPTKYFNLVYKQATMQGFYIFNFQHRFPAAYARLQALIEGGALQYAEDVMEGLENLPAALARVLKGENFGTQLVSL